MKGRKRLHSIQTSIIIILVDGGRSLFVPINLIKKAYIVQWSEIWVFIFFGEACLKMKLSSVIKKKDPMRKKRRNFYPLWKIIEK